ncbi:MAG TPA: CoA transferase [Methylomirabilota bacterium]|jgi:crotonobetainyl-CoA:carnitine CoA-transferase CaiB-like acyl-CoA transferase|nr:CoA transferase [Methylomirabilota bacterium]
MIAVPEPRRALDSVRVLDLATYLAAPVCATLLGEFGAEVIKVEQPRVGDDLRRLGRAAGPDAGGSYWWFVESRNKKSITCNLRDPEGQALIRRLVSESHVLTENFRPGTLERWNLGWEALSAIRRSLVMVRISAFGQTGPSRERPGFGRIAAAVGGLAYLSGYPDRPPVSPGTPTVPDYLAGVFGAVGALVALRHAERSGEGQVVDLALYEPVLRVLDDAIAVYGGTGHVRERIGSGTESAVPHNHFLTRDGRWIAIACTNDRMFARLLQAMERTDLAGDPRMTTTPARLAHRALVDELVAGWVAARDASDALAALEAAEVPSSLVASVRDLFEDAHVRARENIVSVALPLLGRLAMPGVVPRLTLTPGRIDAAGPARPGEHNEEIYGGRLGLSREALARLAERGVI